MSPTPQELAEDMDFWIYFDIADELFADPTPGLPRLTMADFTRNFVQSAKIAAAEHTLPWPPSLPDAEEYLLAVNNRRVTC